MKSFEVSWHASGYTGAFNYLVVAESLEKAKELWDEFIMSDIRLNRSWEKAKKGVKNHYGGNIIWKEIEHTGKEQGCYELEYKSWSCGSDHLRD